MIKSAFWKSVFNRRMLICIFTGFTSGLPLYILISLIPAWLRKEGFDLSTIGLFAIIQFPYTWKFVWAPFMDRYVPPFLGRRRGWLLITQVVLLIIITLFGMFNPHQSIWVIATLSAAVAFFSASQDIVIDAYRRELLPDTELGLGNSIHVNAYRISGLIPGSLSLILADHLPWNTVFQITGLFMLVGICMTLAIKEASQTVPPLALKAAIVEPFQEFIGRKGIASALLILAFMFLYKIGDNMATALATPFYIDMGFTMTEIGLIAKNAALWPAIIGGMLGGLLMVKIGINRALWLFGIVQLVTIIGFVILSQVGNDKIVLAIVISLEYLGVGLGAAAFTAFIARSTHPKYTATQFALFTAFMAVPRTFANASVGFIVDAIGWTNFFIFCAITAIPGMLLLFKVAPWNDNPEALGLQKAEAKQTGN
ncbi:MAG: AmpG family muropeptide MFS transporter [Desulfobacterium sp.]|nr:AmpG family muropeptide MFS transporter [Desulfobacterium sp.]MBU3946617.1 AmpG family muropeptide MFS transporter [Pseudomonadota bacterium]MBU4036843.1 AmpG family muropeptide MFS transporter [Pseudomonadota bacterium]